MAQPHHFSLRSTGKPKLPGVSWRQQPGRAPAAHFYRKRVMANQFKSPRRLALAGGFALAIAAAPAVAAFTAPSFTPAGPLAACPTGETEDTFTTTCTPDLVPNSPAVGQTSPGGLPEVSGIPCTGANSGQCIGLAEEQQAEGPQAVPHSSVSSSP